MRNKNDSNRLYYSSQGMLPATTAMQDNDWSPLTIVFHISEMMSNDRRWQWVAVVHAMLSQVCDGDNLVIADTFIVKGRQKSIELLARLIQRGSFRPVLLLCSVQSLPSTVRDNQPVLLSKPFLKKTRDQDQYLCVKVFRPRLRP